MTAVLKAWGAAPSGRHPPARVPEKKKERSGSGFGDLLSAEMDKLQKETEVMDRGYGKKDHA